MIHVQGNSQRHDKSMKIPRTKRQPWIYETKGKRWGVLCYETSAVRMGDFKVVEEGLNTRGRRILAR